MTTKTAAEEKAEAKRQEARGAFLMKQVSNKLKRQAVAYFDKPMEDFDELDWQVVLCVVADKSRTIAEYDELPVSELSDIILAEAE